MINTTWIPEQHAHEENWQWCRQRSLEWLWLPYMLSQIYVPLALLCKGSWDDIIPWVVFLNLLWCPVRQHLVNVRVAFWCDFIRMLRLPIGLMVAAIFCFGQHNTDNAGFVLFYAVMGSLFKDLALSFPGNANRVEVSLMRQLGYSSIPNGYSKDGADALVWDDRAEHQESNQAQSANNGREESEEKGVQSDARS